jgi:hypothetical protein
MFLSCSSGTGNLFAHQRLDQFPNSRADFGDGSGGIHFFYPLRFGGGDGFVSFRGTFEKTAAGFFDAITLNGHGKRWLADEAAGLCDFVREQKQKRNVRPRISHGGVDDRFDHR